MKVAKAKGHVRGKQPKFKQRREAHPVALLAGGIIVAQQGVVSRRPSACGTDGRCDQPNLRSFRTAAIHPSTDVAPTSRATRVDRSRCARAAWSRPASSSTKPGLPFDVRRHQIAPRPTRQVLCTFEPRQRRVVITTDDLVVQANP